jgi:hypothetical protein
MVSGSGVQIGRVSMRLRSFGTAFLDEGDAQRRKPIKFGPAMKQGQILIGIRLAVAACAVAEQHDRIEAFAVEAPKGGAEVAQRRIGRR